MASIGLDGELDGRCGLLFLSGFGSNGDGGPGVPDGAAGAGNDTGALGQGERPVLGDGFLAGVDNDIERAGA